MVTSNYNNNLIAAAEYGLNPECHIFKYPSKEIVHRFPMDTTVRCIAMCFSRDGRHLLMIGGVPDFKISIFDLQGEGKKLVMPQTTLPCKPEEFLQVKFNPSNRNKFIILSQTTLYSYALHPAFVVEEDGQKKTLCESNRLEHSTFKPESPELCLTRCIWDPYDRVHICTDQPKLLTIDTKTSKLETEIPLNTRATALMLTQRHLIVSLDDGMLQWFKVELPVEVPTQGDKEAPDEPLKVFPEEVNFEWSFCKEDGQQVLIGESDVPDYITYMHYSRSFKTLICGTESGIFGKLDVEAEGPPEEDEDDEGAQQQKQKVVIDKPFIQLGRYHTQRVTGIKELGDTTQLVTICDDHYMNIWEATTQVVLASVFQPAQPSALDVSKDGTAAFIGTALGAFRVYDVRNRQNPRLVQQLRFFEDQVPIDIIKSSNDGRQVLIASTQCKQIFIISQKADDQYKVLGYFELPGKICSASFMRVDGAQRMLAVLHNNLLAAMFVPNQQCEDPLVPIPDEDARYKYRKVDRGSNMVIPCEGTDEVFVTGKDKLLKKYEIPNENLDAIDWKRAPAAPVEEFNSHPVGTSCWHESKEFKFLVTGGKDGTLYLRNFGKIGETPRPVKAHSCQSGGVTALCFSQTRSTVYTAGGDGAVMSWTVGGKPNPNKPINGDGSMGAALDKMDKVERVPGSQIKLYKTILQEEFTKSVVAAKQQFKDNMMQELNKIRQSLMELLAENERCTEIEKLERDEFVIDVMRKDRVEKSGDNECDAIRKEAKWTCLKLQLLKERLSQQTWETMQVKQTAIASIYSDLLVFNFPVRIRQKHEKRRLAQMFNMRKIDLLEQLRNIENKLIDALNECEFTNGGVDFEAGKIDRQFIEQYFVNRVRGKAIFTEDDCIEKAAQEYIRKDQEKKAKKEKMESTQLNTNTQTQNGKKKPQVKITKGKLGVKIRKKDDDDDEEARLAAAKKSSIEIRGMEEMHWQVQFRLYQLENLRNKVEKHDRGGTDKKKKGGAEPNEEDEANAPLSVVDLLYEPFEIQTDVKKRIQIEILRAIVFELKEDFNSEFNKLAEEKDEQKYAISEKNKAIEELYEKLGYSEPLFVVEDHPLENPNAIDKVEDHEVPCERYLTKEQRAAKEEEERIKREYEAKMSGDTVGMRGLKNMLGTTELIIKKEKGGMEQEFVREDWMNKPQEDMSDEELMKLKEFEQKEKEFKEKQRKQWEMELKKIKTEIAEIQARFEERLRTIFKKKLFIDTRIMEQELMIIRLVIMLHDGKETRFDEKKYRREINRLESEKAQKEELINNFGAFVQDLETQLQDQETIREQEKEIKRIFHNYQSHMKAVLNFVRSGRPKKQLQAGEVNPREVELSVNIVELDPFSGHDRKRVKEILKEEENVDEFDFNRDRIGEMTHDEFNLLKQERGIRVDMDRKKEMLSKKIATVQDYINFLETEYSELEEGHGNQIAGQRKAADRINKIRYNFETIIYIKSGQVEVPQLPVATDYKDAILVQQNVIGKENDAIIEKGDKKVELLEQIQQHKTDLRRVTFKNQRLLKEIDDLEERALDVQMYRVTKQTQEIIQGKHHKKDEDDKKRLEGQIQQLHQNAQKRIETLMKTRFKKQKEINDKKVESEELEAKARILQSNVDARMSIMNLKSNTQTDNENDPKLKIKEIAHKRKLLDILKQQTEEMEVLRDELDRLRAKTFPSFAHLHNKQNPPGYPDEN